MRISIRRTIVLYSGLLLIAGSLWAQQEASPKAAPQKDSASTAAHPLSTPSDLAKRFAAVADFARKKGRWSHIPDYVAQDLRLTSVSTDHVFVDMLKSDDGQHELAVVDQWGSNTVLLTVNSGDAPTIYVATRTGVLKQAARITTGRRMHSRSLVPLSLPSARAGFEAERDYWLATVGSPVAPDLAKPASVK